MKLKSGVIGASENEKDQMNGFRLTSKSTDEEVIRWTKSHDVFDRLETGVSEVVADQDDLDEAFRETIFQDNTAQLNMRLPPAMKAVLSKLAPSAHRTRRPLPGYGSPNGWNGNLKRDGSTIAQAVSDAHHAYQKVALR